MIRSTKVSTGFLNRGKRDSLSIFVDEYKNVVSAFIDKLWALDKIPTLLPKELTSNLNTWLSARAVQAAGKQASAIVRGTKTKENRRLWQINKFKSEGAFKKARKLEAIYLKYKSSKPVISDISPELDSRFVSIDLDNKTNFDGWITLLSLGNGLKIKIPFKKTKHFNKMLSIGSLKSGVRLSKDSVTFNFEIEDPKKIQNGSILGIDIGQNSIISCSNGISISKDNHGHDYKTICEKLSRKKKGSKAFKKAARHRSNYINWSVNQLNLSGVKEVRRENIKNMRKGMRTNCKLSHWNYAELFDKLDRKLNDLGVQVVKVSPTYTSQRCSSCGWVRKGNRKGKLFKCLSCGFTHDADLNAALNISFDLPTISKKDRLEGINRKGFYWLPLGQEFTVPVTQKQQSYERE